MAYRQVRPPAMTDTRAPGRRYFSLNSAPSPWVAVSTCPTSTVAPDAWPGEPPPAHQPTTDGVAGIPSVPSAATPTGTTGALTPRAVICSRTGTAVAAPPARRA